MSNIKYIPILFKPEMVNAILEGRKTQTRREAWLGLPQMMPTPCDFNKEAAMVEVEYMENLYATETGKLIEETKGDRKWIACPHGKPGDVLWVRETWSKTTPNEQYIYKADNNKMLESISIGWKPSIHMPKAACRIFLEITDVRVDRIQGITNEDAKAEGVKPGEKDVLGRKSAGWVNYLYPNNDLAIYDNPRCSFFSLWDSINGRDSRKKNPFVWAITFKRIDKPANWIC